MRLHPAVPSNGTRDETEALPISSLQAGMLFQTLSRPRAGFYIQQFRIRLARAIDPEILRCTWDYLANRHDSLRSSFMFEGEKQPRVRIAPAVSVPFLFEDWSGFSEVQRRRRLTAFLRADRKRSFPPDAPPLMRIALFRFGPADHHVVWTSHHLLFDGRSRHLILRELPEVYEALKAGREPALPAAGSQADFLAWLARQDFDEAESYWRSALGGASEPTPVGLGITLPRHRGDHPGRRRYATRFSPALLQRLDRFCASSDLTLNTLLQGAWAVVLSRYSGHEEVVFGAPRAGRHAPVPGLDVTVGVFINALPVRARVADDRPVIDFLRELRQNWIDMRPHEQTPPDRIQRWCGWPEGSPLFDSLVGFENFQLADRLAAEQPWWRGSAMELDGWTTFALTLQFHRGRGLEAVFSYDPERFSAGAMRRLGDHLRCVLAGFLSPRRRTIGDLPSLTAAERRKVLVTWNATAAPYPVFDDVASVFSRVAARRPEAVALLWRGESLTYGGLDSASNAIASWLQRAGIGRGARVGVLLERSFAQVEAILGILKSGAAYVPLDPDHPRERLRFLIADAALQLVFCDEANLPALRDLPVRAEEPARIVDIEAKIIGAHARLNPDPEAPAYVMHTSGSTGEPKGVVVPHRAILRLVFGAGYLDFGSGRTFLHMAPGAFDASTFELWGALLHGARCVLYPERRPRMAELSRQLRVHGVDTLWLTSALFNFVIEEAPEILRPVRDLLVGGEALSPVHVARALVCLPDVRLINGYGPTETTTFACCHPIARDAFDPVAPVPIGRPIGNTTCYVLDRSRRPVPIGVEGELYIGGAGVALGYLNRPELTRERFIANRFSADSSGRLYRTGDRVAWREDGTLEFRGRNDDQVKIRGFRIEPGEVAVAMQQHPNLKQAAILAVESPAGGKELAAFYTLKDGTPVDADRLREFLRERLPSHMIPARFAALDAMPITASGKMDRRALLEVAKSREPASTSGPAATELEQSLAALWCEVLGIEAVSSRDSFFSLGGTSLSVIRLLHRLEQRFGLELTPHAFLENPTIAGLCALISRRESPPGTPSIAELRNIDRGERWEVGPGQAEMVAFAFRPENLARRWVARVFRLEGRVDVRCLVQAIRMVVGRHEALHTHYEVQTDGGVFQVRNRGECPVEISDLRRASPEKRRAEIAAARERAATGRFDPAAEWMHRFELLLLGDWENVLVCRFHHLNFDGCSLNAFYRELSACYRAQVAGDSLDLSARPPQQNDLDDWLARWRDPARLATSAEFWRATLKGAPLVELPLAPDAAAHANDFGRVESIVLDPRVSEKLGGFARAWDTTLHQLLLAGCNAVLHRAGRNNDDVTIAINVDQRLHESVRDVIGCFGKRLPIRTSLAGDPAFSEIVRRVKVRMREALAHRHFPTAEMRKLCGPPDPFTNAFDRIFFVQSPEEPGLLCLPGVVSNVIPRERSQPLGLLSVYSIESPGGLELRATHVPGVLPTESVRALLRIFERLLSAVADGRDPHLSEIPRLGGTIGRRKPRLLADAPPDSDLEAGILKIFQDVLNKPKAGPLDSFFDLGGNSLTAAKLLYRIERSLGVSISYHHLFDHPSARELAAVLPAANSRSPGQPPPEALKRMPRLERTPAKARTQYEAHYLEERQPRNITRAFYLRGPLDPSSLERALQWVVDRHDALRTRLVKDASGVLQMELAPVTVRLSAAKLEAPTSAARLAAVAELVEQEANRAFSLDSFPLFVFRLLRIAEREHVLILNFQHTFFDGPSLAIFAGELSTAYRAFCRQEQPHLPAPAYQFDDVICWIERWLADKGQRALHEFWKEKLQGFSPLSLPIDRRPGGTPHATGAVFDCRLGSAWAEQARETARRLGTTVFGLIHTALVALLRSLAERDVVDVGILCSLRMHPDVENVIGNIGGLVIARTSLVGNPSLRELAQRTRRTAQEALSHRPVSFQVLRSLVPAPELFPQHPFRVLLIDESDAAGALQFPDIEIEPISRRSYKPSTLLIYQVTCQSPNPTVRCMSHPDYFSPQRTEALLKHFVRILHLVVEDPERRLLDFPAFDA